MGYKQPCSTAHLLIISESMQKKKRLIVKKTEEDQKRALKIGFLNLAAALAALEAAETGAAKQLFVSKQCDFTTR